MASSDTAVTACNRGKTTSLPMTAAAWSRCLAVADKRSIRAVSTAWTVSGTVEDDASAPCSTTVRASSSRKKGFPSAFASNCGTSGAACTAPGSTACTTRKLSDCVKGWSDTWVAYDLSTQGGRYPGR